MKKSDGVSFSYPYILQTIAAIEVCNRMMEKHPGLLNKTEVNAKKKLCKICVDFAVDWGDNELMKRLS